MRSFRGGTQAVALLFVLAVAAACTSDDSETSHADTTPTETGPDITLTRPSAPLDVSIAQMDGGVKPRQRAAITEAISEPLASWIDGAYLDAPYPTADFSAGFDSWTPAAAKLGARDRGTTTNAEIGESTVAVVADKQRARLYVFAENGLTGGANAKVLIRLTAQRDDGSLAHFVVAGDVYLTREGNTWSIFGYDLSRMESPA